MSDRGTTVSTFLFTDIEGSTRLLQQLGGGYAALLAQHRTLIAGAVEDHGGRVFGSEGDALFAVFAAPGSAMQAAAAAQRAIASHPWPSGVVLRVRMGVHTGQAQVAGDNYVGLPLHQAARITAAGHGGQVLVSDAARLVAGSPPDGLALRDLGEHRLRDFPAPERLHQLSVEGLADDFPPLRTAAGPSNLPAQLTSFVGRGELAAARAALATTRLLTLTGPGGTGKTRLALQIADGAGDDYPDGVHFVALETAREPDLLPSTIMSALGIADMRSVEPMTRLVEHMHGRRALLVLDNFEQIADAAPAVADMLRQLPELTVLVTSRTVLRVSGEQEFPVPPLSLPEPVSGEGAAAEAARAEAVRLFVERATAVQPSFRLTDDNAPTVVEIVRQLDGLPLAIELAAARTRVFSLEAIRNRLGHRLALLTGGARDVPSRQQTLRGAIDWSYELLDESQRKLLQRFAVFAGGGYLQQAEVVCGPADELGLDVLDGLEQLAERSLLNSVMDGGQEPRFAMLATIREYAEEKAAQAPGELSDIHRRHAESFVQLAEDASPHLTGRDAGPWLSRLAADHDNIRAASEWSIMVGNADLALRLLAAVWRFWQVRGHLYVARDLADRVLAMPSVAQQDPSLQARAYAAAGGICYWQGDFVGAHHYYVRGLEQARRTDDRRAVAEAVYNLGFAPLPAKTSDYRTYYQRGRSLLEESLALYRELDDPKGIADASWALAIAMAADDQLADAIALGHESLHRYRELNEGFGAAWAAHQLAIYSALDDRHDDALRHAREALEYFRAAGDQSGIVLVIADFSWIAERLGQARRAQRLGGAVEALRDVSGIGIVTDSSTFLGWALPKRPPDDIGREEWAAGNRMSIDEAVEYALAAQPE